MTDQTAASSVSEPQHLIVLIPKKESNESLSHQVSEEFCKALGQQLSESVELLMPKCSGGDEPFDGKCDALIEVGEKEIAVELVEYVKHDEFSRDESAERKLQVEMSNALSSLRPKLIRIQWRVTEIKKEKEIQSGVTKRVTLPRSDQDKNDFLSDLTSLAKRVEHDDQLQNRLLSFKENYNLQNVESGMPAPYNGFWISAKEFPNLSQFISSIEFHEWQFSGLARPEIRSNFGFRRGHVDTQFLQRILSEKKEKIHNYRSAIGDRDLWLVVYAQSVSFSTLATPDMRDDVFKIVRGIFPESDANGPRFDKVWWAEHTGCLNPSEIFEVTS
ncbi:MAG: hypothetical protein Tsb009_23100 [Planctomycetaceae bacterium]